MAGIFDKLKKEEQPQKQNTEQTQTPTEEVKNVQGVPIQNNEETQPIQNVNNTTEEDLTTETVFFEIHYENGRSLKVPITGVDKIRMFDDLLFNGMKTNEVIRFGVFTIKPKNIDFYLVSMD